MAEPTSPVVPLRVKVLAPVMAAMVNTPLAAAKPPDQMPPMPRPTTPVVPLSVKVLVEPEGTVIVKVPLAPAKPVMPASEMV